MHITENLISDLKVLGKNHLIALGLSCTGFAVAFSVNKACQWFFDRQDRLLYRSSKKEELRFIIITMIAFCTSAQVNLELANRYLGNHHSHYHGNLRMLAFYISAFALASLKDERRMIRAAIILSAVAAFIHPLFISAPVSAIGAAGIELRDYFNS
jgi:predicted acyltransferase